MHTMEGTIKIEESKFWRVVLEYAPIGAGDRIRFGVPRLTRNSMVEIDFAVDSDNDPFDWEVPSKAKIQREECYKKAQY